MRTMTTLVLAVVTGLSGMLATDARAAVTADEPVPGRLLLVLDASGSMKAKDPSGLTKIEAAKKALTAVVGALPATAQVGLRVYGAEVDGRGKPTPAACADTRLVAPIAAVDKPGLTSTIAAVKALGETPIAHSLEESMKDLGTEGKRNIVLVSDGEESCVPDPCPVVRKLTAAGINLQIDTVGFGVDAKARQQLQCIADAGRGTYYDAKDAPALSASLSKLSQRALRPFAVSGTPVTAASAPESAPTLEAGQYTDTFGVGGPARYYRIEREPGSTVRLSVAMRPPRFGDKWYEEFELKVTDTQGSSCAEDLENRLAAEGLLEVMVARVTVSGDGEKPCATGPLVASVTRGKNGTPEAPVEVLVMEEPPVESSDALPPAASAEAFTAPAAGGGSPVVGGGGFSDALTLEPGTYTEIVLPGEQIFYKVRVGHGQRAAFTVDAPAPGLPLPDFRGSDAAMFEVTGWNPAREPFNHSSSKPPARSTFWGKAPTVASEFVPQVRYRNREGNELAVAPASIAGYYYFSLGREVERADSTANVPLTVRLRLAVDGEVGGEPAYAGPAPDASIAASGSATPTDGTSVTRAADTETDDDAGSGWLLWVGLGLVAVLGALGAAYTVVRARLRGNRTE